MIAWRKPAHADPNGNCRGVHQPILGTPAPTAPRDDRFQAFGPNTDQPAVPGRASPDVVAQDWPPVVISSDLLAHAAAERDVTSDDPRGAIRREERHATSAARRVLTT